MSIVGEKKGSWREGRTGWEKRLSCPNRSAVYHLIQDAILPNQEGYRFKLTLAISVQLEIVNSKATSDNCVLAKSIGDTHPRGETAPVYVPQRSFRETSFGGGHNEWPIGWHGERHGAMARGIRWRNDLFIGNHDCSLAMARRGRKAR